MKLEQLLGICDENKNVVVYEYQAGTLIARYNGRDRITESLNDCEVVEFRGDENGTSAWINIPKVPTLAERVDKVMHDYDPYGYSNMDGSVEAAERAIKENPESVIEELVKMLENIMEK